MPSWRVLLDPGAGRASSGKVTKNSTLSSMVALLIRCWWPSLCRRN